MSRLSRVREHLESADTDFLFFSQTICPYCTRAERTLEAHGLTYTCLLYTSDAADE